MVWESRCGTKRYCARSWPTIGRKVRAAGLRFGSIQKVVLHLRESPALNAAGGEGMGAPKVRFGLIQKFVLHLATSPALKPASRKVMSEFLIDPQSCFTNSDYSRAARIFRRRFVSRCRILKLAILSNGVRCHGHNPKSFTEATNCCSPLSSPLARLAPLCVTPPHIPRFGSGYAGLCYTSPHPPL
jgi:hypothetical protein